MRQLTLEQIAAIPRLRKEGLLPKDIAKKYRVHPTTVQLWIRKLRTLGHDIPSAPIGRPSKLQAIKGTSHGKK